MKYLLDEKLYIDVIDDKQNTHIRTNKADGEELLFVRGGPGLPDRTWVWQEVVLSRFDKDVKEIEVSIYLFPGDYDQNTPTALTEAWFEELKVPYKEYVPFHGPVTLQSKKKISCRVKTLAGKLFE